LSSAWESEQRQNNMINWNDPKNLWMKPEVRDEISKFQESQVEQEFAQAVEEHRVEEVYWVGGEPLMYEQHWRYMQRIIELGDGKNVYARYNTNLSRIEYMGSHLYTDILSNLRDWQICASLDGTEETGEYIRTGLRYKSWLENFRKGLEIQTNPRQMRIDFTLTLPGLFEMHKIQELAKELGVQVLSKVVFSFSPDIMLSPLALPRDILEPVIDDILVDLDPGALRDTLIQLKSRPTFQEQWPTEYADGAVRGKKRLLQLENIRSSTTTMDKILYQDQRVYEWWKNVGSN
jgi:hypothetical protein